MTDTAPEDRRAGIVRSLATRRRIRAGHARLCQDELRTFLQNHRRIDRQQPNQLLAIRSTKIGQRQRAPADEIATADPPAEANIIRRDGPIRLLTDDDEAL